MRILLDESLPHDLAPLISGHQVSTVQDEGWSNVKNGKLLALAATRFDAFITADKNLPYQQNTSTLPVAIFVLDALSNELPYLLPLVPALEAALTNHESGSYTLLRAEA